MSSQRLLIRNGFVVSMDPQIGEIPRGARPRECERTPQGLASDGPE